MHDGYGKPNLLPASQRLDMLRLATENSSWIMVESWECTQPATSPSYAVAQHLLDLSSVGFDKIVFVCGADLAISMTDETKWPRINVQRLCSTASIGVLNRGGSGAPPASLTGEDGQVHPLVIIDVPPLFGSSTEVR